MTFCISLTHYAFRHKWFYHRTMCNYANWKVHDELKHIVMCVRHVLQQRCYSKEAWSTKMSVLFWKHETTSERKLPNCTRKKLFSQAHRSSGSFDGIKRCHWQIVFIVTYCCKQYVTMTNRVTQKWVNLFLDTYFSQNKQNISFRYHISFLRNGCLRIRKLWTIPHIVCVFFL